MNVAGLGCRKGVTADAVRAAIDAALTGAGIAPARLDALATGTVKAQEPALREAALQLGLTLAIIEDPSLADANIRTLTTSWASLAATGSPSLSEAAALAAAGPASRLLGPRIALDGVTCAIATDEALP